MKELFSEQTSLSPNNSHVTENGLSRQLPFVQGVIKKILKSQSIDHFDKEEIAQETIQTISGLKEDTISNLSETDWWYFIKKILARKRIDLYRRNKISRRSTEINENIEGSFSYTLAGTTNYEAHSLAMPCWKAIKKFQLNQKFVILLENDLYPLLINVGVCTATEIALALELNKETFSYFLDLLDQDECSDTDIGQTFEKCYSQTMTAAQVSRSRYKAYQKLKKIFK